MLRVRIGANIKTTCVTYTVPVRVVDPRIMVVVGKLGFLPGLKNSSAVYHFPTFLLLHPQKIFFQTPIHIGRNSNPQKFQLWKNIFPLLGSPVLYVENMKLTWEFRKILPLFVRGISDEYRIVRFYPYSSEEYLMNIESSDFTLIRQILPLF